MIDYRENAKWTVYVHIIPKEVTKYEHDKYYIGITSKIKPEYRWHKDGSGYKTHKYFWNAIQKWGWNNILHEIIASNLTEDEAKNFEKKLIALFNTQNKKYGYNLTAGGEGCVNCKPDESTRLLMSINNSGGKNPNAKRTYQFSKFGIFIKSYDCYVDAAKELDLPLKGVRYAIKNHHLLGGYLWGRDEDVYYDQNGVLQLKYKYDVLLKRLKIYQFTTDGTYINTFNSIRKASMETNISVSTIISVATGKSKAKKYIWRYEYDVMFDNNNQPIIINDYNLYINRIYQFDKYNNYIDQYNSANEASKKTNINAGIIRECAAHNIKTAHNYIFVYENDVYINNNGVITIKNYNRFDIFPKSVFEFDETGQFISMFDSPLEASKITGIDVQRICRSAQKKDKRKTALYWRYKEDVIEKDGSFFIV